MVLAGVNYEALIQRLAIIGVDESYTGIVNKINRGTFSFVFFMQCMEALGVNEFRL
jgi:GMP synthase, PP-ATPase domain/subunit